MELAINTSVYFEKLSHVYINGDGKPLMGVTSLLKKHGLSPDYTNIPEKVLKEAAEKGTLLHEQIESYDNGEVSILTPLLKTYKKVCKDNDLHFIANELLVTDNETVASMIDGVYSGSNPSSVRLVDYKSTSKIHWRSVSWQLSLYKWLFERQYPGVKVESLHVLHIDKKKEEVIGFFPVDIIPDSEVNALFDCERRGEIYQDKAVHEVAPFIAEVDLASYLANYMKVQEMKAAVKELESRLKEIDSQILQHMLDNGINEMQAGDEGVFRVTKEYTKTTLDSTKLKKDLPEVYEKYSKETKVSASLSFKQSK